MKNPDWKHWLNDWKECKQWLEIYLKKDMLRKSADNSRLHLKKCAHNLNLAQWLSSKHSQELPMLFGDETFYDWVIGIYYYAIYHAALALISKEGYASKSHSATLCFLIYHN